MRYPPQFKQDMDAQILGTLPRLASYEGDAPDLRHLVGIFMKTADVEALVYVGERSNVGVEGPDGNWWRPWRHVEIYECGADGLPVVDGYTNAPPIPERGPRAMSTADMGALGYTDGKLRRLAREHLAEEWQPDRVGPSDKRRALFDRVMAAMHG